MATYTEVKNEVLEWVLRVDVSNGDLDTIRAFVARIDDLLAQLPGGSKLAGKGVQERLRGLLAILTPLAAKEAPAPTIQEVDASAAALGDLCATLRSEMNLKAEGSA